MPVLHLYDPFPPPLSQAGGTPITSPTSPYCKAPTKGACAGGGVEVVAAPNTPTTPAEISSGGGFSVYTAQPAYQVRIRSK